MQERAILSVRRENRMVFLNLWRLSPNSDTYVDDTGSTIHDSQIDWSYNNPGYGDQVCVGYGYLTLQYFDAPCDYNDGDEYIIMCLVQF